MAKKKYQADPGGASLGAEVSTVNSYLYLTRPYPYNPDDVVRYGEPTWVFSATGGLSKEHKSLLENFMRDIQNKSGLILPDTIQAKTESPNVNAGMTYIPVLEYLDGLIRAALGMPSLIGASTTEGQTGSYSRS